MTTDTKLHRWPFFADFFDKGIDSIYSKLLLCQCLQIIGGVVQLVRAWDS